MRCHYWLFNTRNIRETVDSFARGPYYHIFKRYVFILLTKMWTKTKTVPWTLYIFDLNRSHDINLPLNHSFQITKSNKHTNDDIWIRPKPNTNDSTRPLSPGIENIHKFVHSTEQTNPEKYNQHTQKIMNLATQLAVKELLKWKCLVQFITTSSNIWFKIFPLTLVVKEQ